MTREALRDAAETFRSAVRDMLTPGAETRPFADALSAIDFAGPVYGPFPRFDHAAMAHLAAAVASSSGGGALDAARAAADGLDWRQLYEGGGIDPAIVDGMLVARVAGKAGVVAAERVALGAFLLAPGLYYPPHTHAAAEVYLCLAGGLEITHGLDGETHRIGPGEASVTPPGQLHSLRVGAAPTLLAYVWTDDVTAPIWWWEETAEGWTRTLWLREGAGPWRPGTTEPVTPAVRVEAGA